MKGRRTGVGRFAAVALAIGLLVTACTGVNDAADQTEGNAPSPATPTPETTIVEATPEPRRVTIVARDFEWDFGGILSFPPGPVTFAFVNEGGQDHDAFLWRLAEGVTFKRFRRALLSDPGGGYLPLPVLELIDGGEGYIWGAPPGTTVEGRGVALEPGTYVLVCAQPDQRVEQGEERRPHHYEYGMLIPFEVTP